MMLDIPDSVVLVAVTKHRSIEEITPLFSQGVSNIGENRIQEAEEKVPLLPEHITKHFIGHLQSNKVKKAVRLFDVIQSVDSIKVAQLINDEAEKLGKVMKVMLQVNIGREEQKYGFLEEELKDIFSQVMAFDHLDVIGLMCILPKDDDSRVYFRQMKELQKKYGVKHLSMGMSNDYLIAIEEGATMVRIGRKLFEK